MKHSRLVFAASAVLALGTWASLTFACDDKASAAAASSKSSTCTAAAAAKCTPQMAAACKTMKAAGMQGCPHAATSSGASASTCPYHSQGATATTARSLDAVTISATPASSAVLQGSVTTYTIKLTSISGYAGAVTPSASGLPTGVTASFSPVTLVPTLSSTVTLTLHASSSAPIGGPTSFTVSGRNRQHVRREFRTSQ